MPVFAKRLLRYLSMRDLKRTPWVRMVLVALAGTVVLPAQAHHSFPATYVVDQTVTVEGTVTEFLFRNPHSFIHVKVMDPSGATVTWAVEWGASGALAADQVQIDTIKPGDKVIVTGNPARDSASHRLRMRSIERPADGWKWAGTFG
jgi:hypothetical protein